MKTIDTSQKPRSQGIKEKIIKFVVSDFLPIMVLMVLFTAGLIWVNLHFGT